MGRSLHGSLSTYGTWAQHQATCPTLLVMGKAGLTPLISRSQKPQQVFLQSGPCCGGWAGGGVVRGAWNLFVAAGLPLGVVGADFCYNP